MEKKLIDIEDAEKILTEIQDRCQNGKRMNCIVYGVLMEVKTVPGNGFQFTCVTGWQPDKSPSWQAFENIGAWLRSFADSDGSIGYTADTTYDTALHYIARAGEIEPLPGTEA